MRSEFFPNSLGHPLLRNLLNWSSTMHHSLQTPEYNPSSKDRYLSP